MSYRLPLALIALAIIMLTGCREPVGPPNNDVHAATVYKGEVPSEDSATGHIDYFAMWEGGDDLYSRDDVVIKWGDNEHDGRCYPRTNGFSVFTIPPIENAENEIWPCTLYYRVHAQCADTNFRLVVTELSSDPRSTSDFLLFWYAWYGDSIAGDICHGTSGEYAIPLSTEACAAITMLADQVGGGEYYIGWITPDTAASDETPIWCWVWGANTMNPPYIKITTP